MKRRTEIVIETERLVVIGHQQPLLGSRDGWCDTCGRESRLVALEGAAVLLGISQQTLRRWADAAHLHDVPSPAAGGAPLVCLGSLAWETAPAKQPVIDLHTGDGHIFNSLPSGHFQQNPPSD